MSYYSGGPNDTTLDQVALSLREEDMGDRDKPRGWQRRLFLSVVWAVVAVLSSIVLDFVLYVLGFTVSAGTHGQELGAALLKYLVYSPIAAGMLVVPLVFGEWGTADGTNLAFILFISVAVDSLLVFLAWEFVHRKRSRQRVSDVPQIFR